MDRYRDNVLSFKGSAKKGEFFVYDTETTGLSPEDADIIEIAALKVAVKDGDTQIIDSIDIYINVGYPIPDVITNITGITDEELKAKGLAPEEAAKKVADFFGDNPLVVGYNSVSFDTAFVSKLLGTIGKEFKPSQQLDVLVMSREKTPKPHKLADMAEKAGLDGIEFHRAIGDCNATLGVLKYLLPMYKEKEPEVSVSDLTITDIRRWTKSHTLDRVYVSNNKNVSLYLDVYTKQWIAGGNIDLDTVVPMVLKYAKVSDDGELIKKFPA